MVGEDEDEDEEASKSTRGALLDYRGVLERICMQRGWDVFVSVRCDGSEKMRK